MQHKLIIVLLIPLLAGCNLFNGAITDAAFEGRLKRVKRYIHAGGDVNLEDIFGTSLLQHAIMGGSFETVTYLVEEGADVNHADDFGDTPLTSACVESDVGIPALLLDHGADPNLIPHAKRFPESAGHGPLHHAVSFGNIQLVTLLIQHGAIVDLPIGGDGPFRGWSPLMVAFPGSEECMDILLTHGADPNFRANSKFGPITPFYQAAERGNLELLEHLASFAPPQDPILIQTGLFRFHIQAGQVEKAKANVAAGADFGRKSFLGKPLLVSVSIRGHTESVRYLLSLDCDPNERSTLDETPLMGAAISGATEVAKILLEAGADPKLENRHGLTALDLARKKGHQDIVELLDNQ